jgi:hypothetical protein
MQHQRMRQETIARFAGHFDHAGLYFADRDPAVHELPHAVDGFIERAQRLHPRTSANQGLARISRAQPVDPLFANGILHQPVRACDKESATAAGSQFCQAREDAHRKELLRRARRREIQMPALVRGVPSVAGIRKRDEQRPPSLRPLPVPTP